MDDSATPHCGDLGSQAEGPARWRRPLRCSSYDRSAPLPSMMVMVAVAAVMMMVSTHRRVDDRLRRVYHRRRTIHGCRRMIDGRGVIVHWRCHDDGRGRTWRRCRMDHHRSGPADDDRRRRRNSDANVHIDSRVRRCSGTKQGRCQQQEFFHTRKETPRPRKYFIACPQFRTIYFEQNARRTMPDAQITDMFFNRKATELTEKKEEEQPRLGYTITRRSSYRRWIDSPVLHCGAAESRKRRTAKAPVHS